MNRAGARFQSGTESGRRPRLLLVSPRPPRQDGQGDQRRAHYAVTALTRDWAVDVVSWLPDVDGGRAVRRFLNPVRLLRALALATVRPLHVAYVQALAPRGLGRMCAGYDVAFFVTDRAVPRSVRSPYVIDFIDDLGGAAQLRTSTSGALGSLFWRWEGRRLRRLDSRLASHALRSLAVSERDAHAISSRVRTIPPAIATRLVPDVGTRVVFFGNLFYEPNVEAATWICSSLAPRLRALGCDPGTLLIAGRRPPASLLTAAAAAGVELRADVPDLAEVLREAAVVIVPVCLGSGVQNKILDAVGAGRACVVTAFSGECLGLIDGDSALVRERTPDAFADAVQLLLRDRHLGERLARTARDRLARHNAGAAVEAWQDCSIEMQQLLGLRRQVRDEAHVGSPAVEGEIGHV